MKIHKANTYADGYHLLMLPKAVAVGNNVDEKERDNVQWSIFIFIWKKGYNRHTHTNTHTHRINMYINFLPHNTRVPNKMLCRVGYFKIE